MIFHPICLNSIDFIPSPVEGCIFRALRGYNRAFKGFATSTKVKKGLPGTLICGSFPALHCWRMKSYFNCGKFPHHYLRL